MTRPGVQRTDRRGPSIPTAGGRGFWLLDPRPDEIEIEDIATSLSQIVRFTGHLLDRGRGYSVAQHSVLVADFVAACDPAAALEALLHDASEAYTNDITSPMKQALEAVAPGVLDRIVEPIEHAIAARFGLIYPRPRIVKFADLTALATEKRDLVPVASDVVWRGLPDPWPERIYPWPPATARAEFLARFNRWVR